MSDGEAGLASLFQIAGGVVTPYKKALYDPNRKGPINTSKPCFTHFNKGCDGSCGGYSHDPGDMEKYGYKVLEELFHSKYGGQSRISRNLDKIVLAQRHLRPGPVSFSAQPKPRLASITSEPDPESVAGGGAGPVNAEPDS
jgi:hypothetical protein